MRHVDEIVKVVIRHPHISLIHKQVLITRINKEPTPDELDEARKAITEGANVYKPE